MDSSFKMMDESPSNNSPSSKGKARLSLMDQPSVWKNTAESEKQSKEEQIKNTALKRLNFEKALKNS